MGSIKENLTKIKEAKRNLAFADRWEAMSFEERVKFLRGYYKGRDLSDPGVIGMVEELAKLDWEDLPTGIQMWVGQENPEVSKSKEKVTMYKLPGVEAERGVLYMEGSPGGGLPDEAENASWLKPLMEKFYEVHAENSAEWAKAAGGMEDTPPEDIDMEYAMSQLEEVSGWVVISDKRLKDLDKIVGEIIYWSTGEVPLKFEGQKLYGYAGVVGV